jgi:protein transport protein SEC23
MKDEVILLLDSYFNLVEWYGPTLYSWYEHRYQEMEDYKHIKDLLDAPK